MPDRSAPGIYAIIASTDAGLSMARIGAAHNLASRPSNYDPTPFLLEPRLMVSYSAVPHDFRTAMADLIRKSFPGRVDDIDWLEYRMECLAIATYRSIWGRLPPGNYMEGSKRGKRQRMPGSSLWTPRACLLSAGKLTLLTVTAKAGTPKS
jgi:hypothetical protein